ncbi:hypothetical protein V6N12_056672 [Hibiscus sabdariffa]|uniref:RNase H type-1 domain-containing protein n=1 Tax=Hibiscus sabdariffa TaxID=183260 RepID=A0ABR1Z7R7_9ROSI
MRNGVVGGFLSTHLARAVGVFRSLSSMFYGTTPPTRHLWLSVVPRSNHAKFFSSSLPEWIDINLHAKFFLGGGSTPWCCFFPSLLWQLWKRRNELVFSATCLPLADVYRISVTCAVYFADICAPTRSHSTPTITYHQWRQPSLGWLCLNADVSLSSIDGVGTIGGVLRDSFGTWLQGYCKCIGKTSTIQAELWGIYVGLQIAWSFGTDRLVVQSDSSQAIKLMLDPSALRHSMQLVRAIAAWRLKLWSLDFQWIPR